MFNRKSSYALNKKDPNAIVYMDANEAIIRLTREDFASEEEFLKSCRTKPIPEHWCRANRVRHTIRSSRWSSAPPPSGCVSRMPTKR